MTANAIRLEELFDKYVRGNITSEEFNEFWRLVKEMQASNALSEKLTSLWQEWETTAQTGTGPDRSKVFSRIMEKGREREIDFEKLQASPIFRRSRFLVAAAVILAALAGLYLLYPNTKTPSDPQQTPIAATPHTDYTRHIILPDSSIVVLHGGSTLDYPAAFPADSREVTLNGEAYFDVRHDNKKPFIIHTGNVRTVVLGTAFNISTEGNKVTVSVTGGKVRVENGKKVLAELAPNQQIVYKVPEETTETSVVNAEKLVTSWTRQDMIFDGDSFSAIADVIAKRYGFTIRFKNPELAKSLIVASFSGTETLSNVLGTLCTIQNATYTMKEDTKEIEIK